MKTKIYKVRRDFVHFVNSYQIKKCLSKALFVSEGMDIFFEILSGTDISLIADIFNQCIYWYETEDGGEWWESISYLWKRRCIEKSFITEDDVELFEVLKINPYENRQET